MVITFRANQTYQLDSNLTPLPMLNTSNKLIFFTHITVLSLTLFLLAWTAISSLTFLSSDTGVRYLQVRELIANDWQTFAVDYPGHFLDPDWKHTPYYHSYSLINDQLHFNVSHLFPLFTSYLFVGFGSLGLAIIPALGGILTAVAIYQLGLLVDIKYPNLLLWTAVFGTPLLIYCLELWDHSIATACATWGLLCSVRGIKSNQWQPFIWSGAAIGVGLGLRPEMYPFAIALGLALLIAVWPNWRQLTAYIGGGMAATLPIWFLQYRWVGHPLGLAFAPNLFGYGRPSAYSVAVYNPINTPIIKIGRWILHIESHDPLLFGAGLLLILGILIFVFSLRVPTFRHPGWLWVSLLLSVSGYGIYVIEARNMLLHGFITTLPLIAFYPAYLDSSHDVSESRPVYIFVLTTTSLFVGLMFALWPAFGGVQWGVRYMLPAYPLFVFIAFYGFTIWYNSAKQPFANALRISFITLIGISFIIQAMGVRYLFIQHQTQSAVRSIISEQPAELILTNNPFLASDMASITTKYFLYIYDEQDMIEVVSRLRQNNIHRFALFPDNSAPIKVPEQIGDLHLKPITNWVYELETNTP